jgi:TolA-binding protein
MNRPSDDLPERLLASDATDFERRVLQAAGQRKPSSSASSRMAKGLGVAAAIGTTAASTATAGATVVWPWVSAGVIGLVVAGAVVGTRARHHEPKAAPAVSAPAAPAPAPSAPAQPAVVVEERPAPVAPAPRRAAAAGGDLREQVAFIDKAREAISTGNSRRALEQLRRYLDKYPSGSFRPEATALKVEALMKLGREAEARALAERFVAENRGSLIARRVADVAGLTER